MKIVKNITQVLGYVFRFCPIYVIASILHIAASVVLSVSKILIIKRAIESVMSGEAIGLLFTSLLWYLVVVTITILVRTSYNAYISPRYRAVFVKKMQNFIFKKVKYIDMESFDNPEFYDNYSRALRESVFRGIRVFEELIKFATSVTSTIAIGTLIIVTDPILIVIILISSIINLVIVSSINKKWYLWSKETETDRRMYNYINRTFYRQKFAGEIKTTPISELLIKRYRESANIINQKYAKTHRTVVALRSINNVSKGLIEQGSTYAYLTYQLFFEGMKVSVFASTINAALQFFSHFVDSVNFLNSLRENSFYIGDFLWFIEYQPVLETQKGQSIETFRDLKLDNLSFQYAGVDFFSLNQIRFNLKRGSKIAIVGPNGGGKTTLTKLLLHFYRPTMGTLLMNDIEYKEMDATSIREKYSVVFQDFQIYALTIGENVLMRKVETPEDEAIVWEALDKVGMKKKVETLPMGIHTPVTREFNRDGAVFSGGEVQRIAISRVFASKADIYILDEPTSSLDPLSEERINKLILKATDKTMIIIAHRLSTVVDADYIYLIDKGKIAEQGTHEEMLMINGLYANMFNTQKNLYQKNK
ncbi:MAG: ABC transporter ATP-binding protein [Bacilli bacterium]|nr:ABC transporter ATP-binding protein [Bacilli bacterium]